MPRFNVTIEFNEGSTEEGVESIIQDMVGPYGDVVEVEKDE